MAITQDYVSWATGNDYKGASFTDGAYTSATKTLVKANAFTASKVNHWLYLESNDGGSIVAGYYKIATWTDASTVILATDAGGGTDDDAAKCTQHDGTTSLPWRSLQGAFDLLTRNTTDGNQVNLKADTAHVNAAALNLTTFIAGGALSLAAPLIIRGYTSAANDGGIGEIDCGGATMFAATTYDFIVLQDLEIHSFGDNNGIVLRNYAFMHHCEIHKGASTPSSKSLLVVALTPIVTNNNIHDAGTSGNGIYSVEAGGFFAGNYIAACPLSCIYIGGNPSYKYISKNTLLLTGASSYGVYSNGSSYFFMDGNIVYNTEAGTGWGVNITTSRIASVINNIFIGFSGAGGEAVYSASAGVYYMLGHNAFYSNTANYNLSDVTFIDLTANDVALAADPFTDAANGDFSLTDAAKTALAAKGFPTAYLGAHANTVSNLNIGPIQLAASSGGGRPAFGDRSGGKF